MPFRVWEMTVAAKWSAICRGMTWLGTSVLSTACTREAPSTLPVLPEMAAPAPSRAQASRLSVPLAYDITAVMGLVEHVVPTRFGSMDSVKQIGDNDRRHYAFQAVRGPFTAFADGNLLHLRATISYQARGFIKPPIGPTISAGCGQGAERPRLVVELATPLTLTTQWHLASKARIVTVAPASAEPRDHCDVSILHKDVTEQVVGAARGALADRLSNIDEKVGSVDLTKQVTEWWQMLARPIKLTDGIWLTLGPEQLSMGHVRGHSRTLVVPVRLDAHPAIITGSAEPVMLSRTLPPLARDTSTGDGYHIVMDGVVDYGTASRELGTAFGDKTFNVSGHPVRVAHVTVLPKAGGKLGLSAAFTGDATGTIELVGTPAVNHVDGTITVPDLDFDLQSSNPLLKSYSWLRSGAVRAELRKRARIPIAPVLARGKALLLEGLNRRIGDAVTLSGSVDSLAVVGLFVTRDGMTVRAEARGQAGLAVKQH